MHSEHFMLEASKRITIEQFLAAVNMSIFVIIDEAKPDNRFEEFLLF